MRVEYSGARNYKTSAALISARADDERDRKIMERVCHLLYVRNGWDYSICGELAVIDIEDREEYDRYFLAEYKAAKKCIMNCAKYGF